MADNFLCTLASFGAALFIAWCATAGAAEKPVILSGGGLPAPASEETRTAPGRAPMPRLTTFPSKAPAANWQRPAALADCDQAMNGNAEAAFRIARRQIFGLGLPRDPRAAVAWLRFAAAKGHVGAIRLVHLIPRDLKPSATTCRLGGGSAALPTLAPKPAPESIAKIVERVAPENGLDPKLVLAVIRAESAFQPDAVSPKAAAGLMQLIPATADRFAVPDVFDPEANIRGGCRYLRWLLSYFRGDVTLALAGYNAGEGAVDRYRGVPPYAETRNYVAVIRRLYGELQHPYDPLLADPSPVAPLREVGRAAVPDIPDPKKPAMR